MKRILIEESIRLMAPIGGVMFVANPIAVYLFGLDPVASFSVLVVFPFIISPILVLIRWRTGWTLQATTKRGWVLFNAISGVMVSAALALAAGIGGAASWPLAIMWFVASLLALAVLVASGLRTMPLKGGEAVA